MRLAGRIAYVFGDDFDVDEIVGVENIRTTDVEFLRRVCMTPFEPDFAARVEPGDLLVGGRNFGYGHPHDQPMWAMRALGIAGVVAESFAPLFARSEIFNGFPLLSCPGIAAAARRGERIAVEWEAGEVRLADGTVLRGVPPTADAVRLVSAGGGHDLLLASRRPA